MAMTAILSLFTKRNTDKRHRSRGEETKRDEIRQNDLYKTRQPETIQELGNLFIFFRYLYQHDTKFCSIPFLQNPFWEN